MSSAKQGRLLSLHDENHQFWNSFSAEQHMILYYCIAAHTPSYAASIGWTMKCVQGSAATVELDFFQHLP